MRVGFEIEDHGNMAGVKWVQRFFTPPMHLFHLHGFSTPGLLCRKYIKFFPSPMVHVTVWNRYISWCKWWMVFEWDRDLVTKQPPPTKYFTGDFHLMHREVGGGKKKQVEYCDLHTLLCVCHQDIIIAYFGRHSGGICPTHERPVLIRQQTIKWTL